MYQPGDDLMRVSGYMCSRLALVPRVSGRTVEFPEVDRCEWFRLDVARTKVTLRKSRFSTDWSSPEESSVSGTNLSNPVETCRSRIGHGTS